MKITIPNIALPEVRYTFHCLLKEFLGLEYELEISEKNQDYIISNSGKSIVIKNCFFRKETPDAWYQIENIPKQVDFEEIEFGEKKYPIHGIFGKPELRRVGEESYILETDIIASTFFMLTRWEEMANPKRDVHLRFSAKDSLAYQNNFLQKPVVNEYVELVWALLQKIGISQKRKARQFSIVPTHDVDNPYMFPSTFLGLKSIARHLLFPNTFLDGVHYLKDYLKGKDSYDTHDIFLEGAEKLGVKAHFFFMSGGKNKYDPRDQIAHPKVKQLIEKIKERGHHIGFHPSYDAYRDSDVFQKEKKRLEEIVGEEVMTGRQHYLRFEVPATWKMWEAAGMEWDSTMSYADDVGFRCGVCYGFPVYDVLGRRQLNLYERPLVLMEVTLGLYLNLSLEAATIFVKDLIAEVEKYQGEFVFLWHNSSLKLRAFSTYNTVLQQIYKN